MNDIPAAQIQKWVHRLLYQSAAQAVGVWAVEDHLALPNPPLSDFAAFDFDKGWLRADGTPVYAEALKRG